jgi:hypothetical protein
MAIAGHLQGMTVIGQRKSATFGDGGAAPDRCRVEMAEIDEYGSLPVAGKTGVGGDGCDVQFDLGNARAVIQHAAVADDDEPGLGPHVVQCQQPGGQFGADAGRIAHRQRDDRSCHACVVA